MTVPPPATPPAPRVSVVVTCHDLGAYLDEAVDSVLAQTFTDLEILVVDDGSTDPYTRALVDGYDRPRTRVLCTPNLGLPAAKNAGLAHTTGEYVCMVDADDRLDPHLIARSVEALDRDSALAFVSHWLRTFGDENADWTPVDCGLPALLDRNTVNGAAVVRRSAAEAVGGFDEAFREGCEDWDFWISLVERGHRGHILPEVLYHYRRRSGSMTAVMARDGRHPDLYRRLVLKHADTFAANLPTLLARRDDDLAAVRRETHRLELDWHETLGPALQTRRDDDTARERRAARVARDREAEATRAASVALTSEVERLVADVEALRHSWSWRVTGPLRTLYGAWLRSRPGRRD